MPVDVAGFLARKISEASDDVAEDWQTLEALHARKLWHQLTMKLEEFVRGPAFANNTGLVELYSNFICDFEDRIKPESLVGLALVIIQQIDTPDEALTFLEPIQRKVKSHENAVVSLNTARADLYLRMNKLDQTKELLEKCAEVLDTTSGVSPMHAHYYRVAAEHNKILGKFAEFYVDALRYLGCVELSTISVEQQVVYAYDLCLAALLAESVFNFGELLAHPVLEALRGTEKQWLVDLVTAFNSGDIAAYEKLQPQWAATEDLKDRAAELRNKISLLALMETVFKRPSKQRNIAFADIAAAARIPADQVETLVMRGLSRGLVKGCIDEVDQIAHLHWVQPRVLDVKQLATLTTNLKLWSSTVSATASSVEAQAPELFVQ